MEHREAMLCNMTISLITHERIRSTIPKLKEARRYAEKLITMAKKNDQAARRRVFSYLQEPVAVDKLFDIIVPRFAERSGGYTRVMRTGFRKGDAAEVGILELV